MSVTLQLAAASGEVAEVARAAAVDFTPVVSALIQLFAATLMGVGTIAIGIFCSWLQKRSQKAGYDVSDAQRTHLEAELRRGFAFAVERTQGLTAAAAAQGNLTFDMKNHMVANVTEYLIHHSPELLKACKIMGADGQIDQERVTRAVESQLGMLQISQATAPATLASATASEPPVSVKV